MAHAAHQNEQTMDLDLKGKSIVVTGGGWNIGRAIVKGFAAEGANITIADLDIAQAEATAAEANSDGASGCQAVKTDVTDLDQVRAMFASVVKAFGTVDVLANNAGWDKLMSFTQTDPDFWRKIMNCELRRQSQLHEDRAGSDDSEKVGRDRFHQLRCEPREAVYGGMKAAVNSFMKTIAKENGRYGIRCNVVCPGVTIPPNQSDVGSTSM